MISQLHRACVCCRYLVWCLRAAWQSELASGTHGMRITIGISDLPVSFHTYETCVQGSVPWGNLSHGVFVPWGYLSHRGTRYGLLLWLLLLLYFPQKYDAIQYDKTFVSCTVTDC